MNDYSFFDSLLDAVFVLDECKRIRYCNESGASLCRSSVRRLTKGEGTEIYKLLEFSDESLFATEAGTVGQNEPAPWVEIDYKNLKDGQGGKIQIAIQPFKSFDAQSRWVVTLHDVTLEETLHSKYQGELEEKEGMIEELKQARAKLEAYSKNLEQMVEERTAEVKEANRMLNAIMNSLGQGFLVFNSSGECGQIYTKACEDVLEGLPSGKTIFDVLKMGESEKDQFKMWASATFSESLPFDSMKELAPSQYKHTQGKFVTLDYFPIRDEQDTISNVVLVATDKTAEHEANLALERERQFAQMVVKLIKNKEHFSQFLKNAQRTIGAIRQATQCEDNFDSSEVFRILHTLEGEAGAFGVWKIRQASRDCQQYLEILNEAPKEKFKDAFKTFNDSIVSLQETYNQFLDENKEIFSVVSLADARVVEISMDDLTEFYDRMSKLGAPMAIREMFRNQFFRRDINESLKHFEDVARTIAEKQGKKIKAVIFDSKNVRIYPECYKELFASMVHVFRNAVDHGLESPEDRLDSGKDEGGTIEILTETVENKAGGWIRIQIRDDGRGIDPTVIRSKLQEKVSGSDFSNLSDDEVLQQIFNPGFSSRSEVGEFSGRGVGMDAIKSEVIKLGGSIKVESKVGEGTLLTVEIPDISRQDIYARSA